MQKGSTEGEIHRVGCGTLRAWVRDKCHTGEGRQVPFGQHKKKRSKKSWNGNRTGTEIVKRVYRVMRRKQRLGSWLQVQCAFPSICGAGQSSHRRCAFVLCSGSTQTCSRDETKAKT